MAVILSLYLAALVFIAFRSAKNVKDVQDFFVARKGGSIRAVAGSLVATILGGSAVIGAIDAGPKMGGATAWFMLTGAIGLLALLPFTRRAYSLGKYTLPDLVETLFGTSPKIVASVVIPIAWTGIVAAQIIAASKLLMYFIPVSYPVGACISAAVFIFYTIAGGQISVLRTDFLQAILIIAGLILLAFFAAKSGMILLPAAESFTGGALSSRSGFPFNENFTPFDLFLLLFTYGTTFTVGPDMFSRIFCARDYHVAKRAISVSVLVLVPVAAIIGYLSVFGASLGIPEGGISGAKIMQIATAVFPPYLFPLIALSLLSVVLSSADTTLLSSSIILWGLFKKRQGSYSPKSGKTLWKIRLVILLNGSVALLIALQFTDIISTLLLSLAVYAGAFTVPVIWGLAGGHSKPVFVAVAMILGGALSLLGKFTNPYGDILQLLAFAVNGAVLLMGWERYSTQDTH